MSRAFINEDADGWSGSVRRFNLPPRNDPLYDQVAAITLLEAARDGDTGSAEAVTGYYWGEPRLRPYIEAALQEAQRKGDERLIQLAERFLK